MAGPWERYQAVPDTTAPAGPWQKYGGGGTPLFPARTGGMDPDLRMRRTFSDIGMPDQSRRSIGGDLLASELSSQGASQQGTSPFLAGRQPLGEVEQYDFGPAYHDQSGAVRAVNPETEVILNDPQTNRAMVFPRTEETNESGLMGLSRLFLGGAAAGAPTRVASGAGRRAAGAARAVEAFNRSNVDPSLLTALESRAVRFAGEAARNIPGGGAIQRSVVRQTEQAGQRAEQMADTITDVGDMATAGARIREGTREFAETLVPRKQGQLYDVAERLIGPKAASGLSNVRRAINQISGQIQSGAVRDFLTDPNFKGLADVLTGASKSGLSFGDLRRVRTRIRNIRQSAGSAVGIDPANLGRLYDAMTRDMMAVARAAGGDRAAAALRRADVFTRRMLGDDTKAGIEAPVNIVRRLITDKSDEQVSRQLMTWASKGAGADYKNLAMIKRVIPGHNWDAFVGTFLRQMGRPRAGNQAVADAAEFSPASFMTNYESLSRAGKRFLFGDIRNRPLRSALDDLLVVAGRLKNSARFGNPSGSAAHFIQYATPFALFSEPLTTLSVLGTNVAASQIMTSPRIVRWITGSFKLAERGAPPRVWQRHVRSLSTIAANDNQILEPLTRFSEQLRQAARGERDEDTRRRVGQP